MRGRSASPAPWIALFGVWVILSGKIDAFHLGLGAITILFLAWLHRALKPIRPPGAPRIRIRYCIPYFGWLIKEMFMSAVYVARVVINPDKHLDPGLLRFRVEQPSPLNAVLFAHSITLTPGTITLDLEDDVYSVHALTPVTAKGVLEGTMYQRVAKLSVDQPIAPPQPLSTRNEPEVS